VTSCINTASCKQRSTTMQCSLLRWAIERRMTQS